MNTNQLALPANVELGDYRILRTLGQGGFGITYLAESIADGKQVVIKENLPTFCAYRNTTSLIVASAKAGDEAEEYHKQLTRFVEEARLLARLNHPNIVKVNKAFEALGTAYYVMPWVGGQELHKAAPAPQDITEAGLRPILRKLLEALNYLHSQNIYHRDIKPANILLKNKKVPVIIDFGTARSIISERSATMVGSPGYSPIEQITTRGKRGPWTDLYSLGATCYRLITGSAPPEANERLANDEDPLRPLANRAELRGRFSVYFLTTIDKALALRAKNRWQTAGEWLNALSAILAPKLSVKSAQSINTPIKILPTHPLNVTQSTKQKKSRLLIPLSIILIGVFSAGGYLFFHAHGEKKSPPTVLSQQDGEERRKAEAREHYQQGENYLYGLNDHEQSYQKAIQHFRIAANEGNKEALHILGVSYELGHGVPQDYTEAINWYRKAAELGHAEAQYKLGSCYEYGRSVTQNYSEAFEWYKKSAEQGNPEAQFNLGFCYEKGSGTTKDLNKAEYWYSKAAEQGHKYAQNALNKLK
ncbi:MAG: SEL1-like repeat protein [Akkermansia sp.]|nr:SEL1-like repeat protein [Akkermansia sp.]